MDDRTFGRAAFLGVLGAGIAGLFLARDAFRLVGRLIPDGVESLVPNERVAHLHDRNEHAQHRAGRLPTAHRRPRRAPHDAYARRPALPPRAEQVSDFHCVTGWSVSDVRWAGVRLDDVIATARPKEGWRSLRFVSDEAPYDDSLTSEQALLPDVMLALEMDGGPLSRPHGGPARVVMPQMYGYKSVKWVTGIDVRTDVIPGYWEQHGYDADAWVGRSTPPGIVPVLSGSTLVDLS